MVRYVYIQQMAIPAPFVHVALRPPDSTKRAEEVPALVDSGADRTVIPSRYIGELGLAQMGRLSVAGFGGQVVHCPTFLAEITIRNCKPIIVKVLANEGESNVLLGRDVLNHFRVVLNGPQLALEIEG